MLQKGKLIGALVVGLSAYSCLQVAAFDELRFSEEPSEPPPAPPSVECRSHGGCPASDTVCKLPRCLGGRCLFEAAPAETPCAEDGADECNGAGQCIALRHAWSRRFGDERMQLAHGAAVDSTGRWFVVGETGGTIHCGGKALHSNDYLGHDAFLLKLDASGDCIWGELFGDKHGQVATAVATDPSDDVWVAGYFDGAIRVGGEMLRSTPKPSTGGAGGAGGASASGGGLVGEGGATRIRPKKAAPVSTDAFVVKLDSEGRPLWGKAFGDGQMQYASSIAVDHQGAAAIAGRFEGSMAVGTEALTSSGLDDAFVIKLNGSGATEWGMRFGNELSQRATAVAFDNNDDLLVCGWFRGTMNVGATELTAAGRDSPDLFVAKLDTNGNVEWARRFGDEASQKALSVAVTPDDRIVVVGEMFGSMLVDSIELIGEGGGDAFVLELSSDGTALRAWRYGNDARQVANGLAVTTDSERLVTGIFGGTMQFDESHELRSPHGGDVFLAMLSGAGHVGFAYRFGDLNHQVGRSIAVYNREAVVVGDLWGAASLGGAVLTSEGQSDLFVAKYNLF